MLVGAKIPWWQFCPIDTGEGVIQILGPTPLRLYLVVLLATKKKKGYKGVNIPDLKLRS
jgi:hypothetical protein